ncbi:helix-turn-helix domain-containing protein [Paenibacillus sp. sgz302251]|uniref:helix-turn-helix domain-containing protein n=1 Tax=Paenibacillus sp. sgz302251 TaxID=3414493 RepID=UPI003C7B6F3E
MEGFKEKESLEDIDDSQYEAGINEWEAQFSSEDRLKLYNQQYMTSKEEVLHKLDLHIKYIERRVANNDDDPTFATTKISFLRKFKEKIELTTLFKHLEDWWSYQYSLSSRGAVLYLVHARGVLVDFNMSITCSHDTIMKAIEFPAQILTVDEYAKSIGVKSGAVRQWIRRAKIRSAFKQGQEWRIPELSSPIKRGYIDTRYVWTEKLTDPPEGYKYLSEPSSVSIHQDLDDKKYYELWVSAPNGGIANVHRLTEAEREKLELYLISKPEVIWESDHYTYKKSEGDLP